MSEKYTKPHLGQTFFRHPNQDKLQRDFSMCVGLTENGEVRGELHWSAILQDGRGGTEQITHRSVLGSGSWRPLPQEELETQYGPGYRALAEKVVLLADAVALLGTHISEVVTNVSERLAALEKVQDRKNTSDAPALTPPVEPVGARPPPRRVVEAVAPR